MPLPNTTGLQVYRSISEGVINLADCFFDMEYVDANKGLEIYRQSIVDNDRLSVSLLYCGPRFSTRVHSSIQHLHVLVSKSEFLDRVYGVLYVAVSEKRQMVTQGYRMRFENSGTPPVWMTRMTKVV